MRILSNICYKKCIDYIVKYGNEVNGTYEIPAESVTFMGLTSDIKEIFGITDEFERAFIESIASFDKKEIGPYNTEKYFHLIPGVKEAARKLSDDCLETRRAVIQFPKDHCFQSMQFLFRDNTVNVVCYMRSCDAIRNLPHDIWICSKMADIFAKYLEDVFCEHPYKYHNISMMFGSLHVYRKDLKNP